MVGNEKRIHDAHVRFTPSEWISVTTSAAAAGRSVGDYLHDISMKYLDGHKFRVPDSDQIINKTHRHE